MSQYHPIFFNYNRDLTELALIASGIPQFFIAHPSFLLLADSIVLFLPLLLLIQVWRKGRFSQGTGIVFCCCFTFYHLLDNLFWKVDHEPFMLYVFLSLAFVTNKPETFYRVLRFCRYYFLYIFASAAIWKIARGGMFNGSEMSHILLLHQSERLAAPCTSFRCQIWFYLIDHPALSWWLYGGSVLLELVFIAGFFTRRYDRMLFGLAVLFVAADFWLMRIPYWTILMGSVTLLIGRRRKKVSGLLLYETTHHENLPAMLDLGEDHFEKVTVFVSELSYTHISGRYDPALKWPRTSFVVQPAGCGNRRFIIQLFDFLKTRRYSHLHINTLDNNWLLFAVWFVFLDDVHISMTIHAVNEYFAYPLRTVKDWTETIAKRLLHRRVRHYMFYLPMMAERFRQLLPGAVAVAIPSRFYTSVPALRHAEAASGTFAPDTQHAPVATDAAAGTSPRATADAAAPFRIIVPGSVDPNRRDYSVIADFLTGYLSGAPGLSGGAVAPGLPSSAVPPEPIAPHVAHRKIQLTILGNSDSAFGESVIDSFRHLPADRFELITFKGYVPQNTYETAFDITSLIWSPLQSTKTSDQKGPEVYGETIASGLTADLQLSNAPALVPGWLKLPDPFSAALLPYSDNSELTAIFNRLLNDENYLPALREKIDHAFVSVLKKENYTPAFLCLIQKEKKGDAIPVER